MNARQPLSGDLHWIDGLATLSGLRDRDRLALSLADVVQGLVQPLDVQVWRVAGQGEDLRWLPQVRLLPGQPALAPSATALDWQALQPLSQPPRWPDAVHAHEAGHCSLFELGAAGVRQGALLLCTPLPLPEADERLVRGVLRMYENVLGLLDYSERDELTGLLNRKTFDENFLRRTRASSIAASVVAEAGSERRDGLGMQTWLGVIDIDHFKRVNDTHGHLIGDRVIQGLGEVLRTTVKVPAASMARYGGEEFAILLPRVSVADSTQIAEAVRERTKALKIRNRQTQEVLVTVTISGGLAQWQPGEEPDALIARADAALYRSKQTGRDRVTLAA